MAVPKHIIFCCGLFRNCNWKFDSSICTAIFWKQQLTFSFCSEYLFSLLYSVQLYTALNLALLLGNISSSRHFVHFCLATLKVDNHYESCRFLSLSLFLISPDWQQRLRVDWPWQYFMLHILPSFLSLSVCNYFFTTFVHVWPDHGMSRRVNPFEGTDPWVFDQTCQTWRNAQLAWINDVMRHFVNTKIPFLIFVL